jgi:hypothetical protein
MRLHASIVLAFLLITLIATIAPAAANNGDYHCVIIMFYHPVTPYDMDYLRAMGAMIKYTCSPVHGVSVEMPASALDKLMTMFQNPSSPQSDSIARNISFIVDDGMAYPFGNDTTVTPAPESIGRTTDKGLSSSLTAPAGIVNMFAFPVLPLPCGQ